MRNGYLSYQSILENLNTYRAYISTFFHYFIHPLIDKV